MSGKGLPVLGAATPCQGNAPATGDPESYLLEPFRDDKLPPRSPIWLLISSKGAVNNERSLARIPQDVNIKEKLQTSDLFCRAGASDIALSRFPFRTRRCRSLLFFSAREHVGKIQFLQSLVWASIH